MHYSLPFKRSYELIFFLIVLLLYVLLASNNNTTDALAYAAQVKYAEELFLPHHLLYNAFMWLLLNLFEGVTVLEAMIIINALCASTSIWVSGKILSLLGQHGWRKIALLSIAAFSFGFWRFATENETYIIPILLSLAASYYYIRSLAVNKGVHAFLAGCFAALAMVFHQIHLFWWFGLLIGFAFQRPLKWKPILYYLIPAIIVPLAYIWVFVSYYQQDLSMEQLWVFATRDVQEGSAGFAFELKFLLLGAVSLVRTFIQVHGMVMLVLSKYPLLWGALAIVIALFTVAAYFTIGSLRKDKWWVERKAAFRTHLLIFLFQLGFAVYAVGNAEFMAMLPVLVVISLACMSGWRSASMMAAGAGLLLWNFLFGIWPQHSLKLSADKKIAAWSLEHPDAVVVAAQYHTVSNVAYYYDKASVDQLLRAPSYYKLRQESDVNLQMQVDQLLEGGIPVYTDCTGRPALFSRASLELEKADEDFFKRYMLTPAESFPSDAGPHILYRVSLLPPKEGN